MHRGRRPRAAIDAAPRVLSVTRHHLLNRERIQVAATAARMRCVSRWALVNNDFDRYWAESPALPIQFISKADRCAHEACLRTLANVVYRASYAEEVC